MAQNNYLCDHPDPNTSSKQKYGFRSRDNSPLPSLPESATTDWTLQGIKHDVQNRLYSQIFLEIYQQVLRRLSIINRDDLIKRSHENLELSNLQFFIDTSQSQNRNSSRSQPKKKELNQKIQNFNGKTRLRYAHAATDYIVVEPEFFKSSGVFANKSLRKNIIKHLSPDAQRFFQQINSEQEFSQICSSSQFNPGNYRLEFFDCEEVDQFLVQESFNILKEIKQSMDKRQQQVLSGRDTQNQAVCSQEEGESPTDVHNTYGQSLGAGLACGQLQKSKQPLSQSNGQDIWGYQTTQDVQKCNQSGCKRQNEIYGPNQKTNQKNSNQKSQKTNNLGMALGKGRQVSQRTFTSGQMAAQGLNGVGLHLVKTQQNVNDQLYNNPIDKQRAVAQFYRQNIQNLIEIQFVPSYITFRARLNYQIKGKDYKAEINRKQLQGDLADDILDLKAISAIFKVIEVKDLEYAIDFHASNTLAWHNERQVTLSFDYERISYLKGKHFVLSKIDYNKELYSGGGNLSRMQKGTQLRQVLEQEKQVYHAFDEVEYQPREEMEEGETTEQFQHHLKEKEFIQDHVNRMNIEPIYDLHHLRFDEELGILDGPIGMDPCQTLVQFAYAKIKSPQIEQVYRKDLKRSLIKQGDLSEGVFREDLDYIPVPQPQNYHNYCQICQFNFENFDKHIQTDFHQRKSRNQAQLADIDNIIDELKKEKRWETQKVNPQDKKDTKLGDVELCFAILKDGKSIKHYKDYKKEHCLDEYGRRISGKKSTPRVRNISAKSMTVSSPLDRKRVGYSAKPKNQKSPQKDEKVNQIVKSRSLERNIYLEQQAYEQQIKAIHYEKNFENMQKQKQEIQLTNFKSESPKKQRRSPYKKRDQKSQFKEFEKSYTLKENFQRPFINGQTGIMLYEDRLNADIHRKLIEPQKFAQNQKIDFEPKHIGDEEDDWQQVKEKRLHAYKDTYQDDYMIKDPKNYPQIKLMIPKSNILTDKQMNILAQQNEVESNPLMRKNKNKKKNNIVQEEKIIDIVQTRNQNLQPLSSQQIYQEQDAYQQVFSQILDKSQTQVIQESIPTQQYKDQTHSIQLQEVVQHEVIEQDVEEFCIENRQKHCLETDVKSLQEIQFESNMEQIRDIYQKSKPENYANQNVLGIISEQADEIESDVRVQTDEKRGKESLNESLLEKQILKYQQILHNKRIKNLELENELNARPESQEAHMSQIESNKKYDEMNSNVKSISVKNHIENEQQSQLEQQEQIKDSYFENIEEQSALIDKYSNLKQLQPPVLENLIRSAFDLKFNDMQMNEMYADIYKQFRDDQNFDSKPNLEINPDRIDLSQKEEKQIDDGSNNCKSQQLSKQVKFGTQVQSLSQLPFLQKPEIDNNQHLLLEIKQENVQSVQSVQDLSEGKQHENLQENQKSMDQANFQEQEQSKDNYDERSFDMDEQLLQSSNSNCDKRIEPQTSDCLVEKDGSQNINTPDTTQNIPFGEQKNAEITKVAGHNQLALKNNVTSHQSRDKSTKDVEQSSSLNQQMQVNGLPVTNNNSSQYQNNLDKDQNQKVNRTLKNSDISTYCFGSQNRSLVNHLNQQQTERQFHVMVNYESQECFLEKQFGSGIDFKRQKVEQEDKNQALQTIESKKESQSDLGSFMKYKVPPNSIQKSSASNIKDKLHQSQFTKAIQQFQVEETDTDILVQKNANLSDANISIIQLKTSQPTPFTQNSSSQRIDQVQTAFDKIKMTERHNQLGNLQALNLKQHRSAMQSVSQYSKPIQSTQTNKNQTNKMIKNLFNQNNNQRKSQNQSRLGIGCTKNKYTHKVSSNATLARQHQNEARLKKRNAFSSKQFEIDVRCQDKVVANMQVENRNQFIKKRNFQELGNQHENEQAALYKSPTVNRLQFNAQPYKKQKLDQKMTKNLDRRYQTSNHQIFQR